MKNSFEHRLEHGLFASRWLMAPFYVGLVGALALLLISFLREMFKYVLMIPDMTVDASILAALTLIDLSLAGNLLLIVIYSGYENFVSKMDIDVKEDKFEWRGTVDFAALKLKLIASIVAISGIHLLKVFMGLSKYSEKEILWMTVIHVVFVLSGVLLALMDRLAAGTKAQQSKKS